MVSCTRVGPQLRPTADHESMRVLITGATGFVGRALVPALQRDGHTVVVWARDAARARARLGADIETLDSTDASALIAAVERCHAVINLAGEPVVGARWTEARRAVIRDSRVAATNALAQAIGAAAVKPQVLVSASAVGYYGDRGHDVLREDSLPGSDSLAQTCHDWEAAAVAAERHGVRVALLRIGVVLGRDGGALAQMLPPFRLGLGGPIGGGRQYLPWIHLHDLVGVITAALTDDRYRGPVNAVAPEPVTNLEFARQLGRVLGRPAIVPVPALALKAAMGEAASVLLGSQRVAADALSRLGFSFAFPTLAVALAEIVGGADVALTRLQGSIDALGSAAGRRYLDRRRPIYELRTTTIVNAPIEKTFEFFSKAENLGLMTPSAMGFSIKGAPPRIGEDTIIDYQVRVGGLPINGRTRIVTWRPGERFVDLQEKGPYRAWWHEHVFRDLGSTTKMDDRVCYAPPLGPLGRIANRVLIAPMLRRIFQYRADVIRLRFGPSSSSSAVAWKASPS